MSTCLFNVFAVMYVKRKGQTWKTKLCLVLFYSFNDKLIFDYIVPVYSKFGDNEIFVCR